MFISRICAASAMKLPDTVAFSMFGMEIYWFGLLLAAGVIVAIILTHMECRRKALPADTAVDLCLVILPCGVIGARIVYVLFHLSRFTGRAVQTLYLWDGGLSIIGGILFALIGIWIYARKKRVRFLKLLDVLAPGVTAALAISVWGSFFNQSFYGPRVTSGALKWFPLCVRLDGGDIHLALFFYLFVWLVLLFVCLRLIVRKRTGRDGDAIAALMALFCPAYAVLSLFRLDKPDGYPAGQIACAVLFVLGCLHFLVGARLHKQALTPGTDGTESAETVAAEPSQADGESRLDEAAEAVEASGNDDAPANKD